MNRSDLVKRLRVLEQALIGEEWHPDYAETCHNTIRALEADTGLLQKALEALERNQWSLSGVCVCCREPIHLLDCIVGQTLAALHERLSPQKGEGE